MTVFEMCDDPELAACKARHPSRFRGRLSPVVSPVDSPCQDGVSEPSSLRGAVLARSGGVPVVACFPADGTLEEKRVEFRARMIAECVEHWRTLHAEAPATVGACPDWSGMTDGQIIDRLIEYRRLTRNLMTLIMQPGYGR